MGRRGRPVPTRPGAPAPGLTDGDAMISSRAADRTRARCRTGTCLTAGELATLTALPHPAQPVPRDVSCELATGHDAGHVAFIVAAHDGDQWWWLRWTGESRDLVQIDPCTAERATGPYRDCCLLPDQHPGPHSFDLESP